MAKGLRPIHNWQKVAASLLLLCALPAAAKTQAELEAELLGTPAPTETSPDTPAPSMPAPPSKEAAREKDLQALDEAVRGPRQVPFEQILVVQRRYIHKEGRHEITPLYLGLQPAGSFRKQGLFGFGYTYHLNEKIGLELLNFRMVANFSTGLADTLHKRLSIETDRVEPVYSLSATVQWTPLNSKAAAFDAIHSFEGYFLGGGGITRFEDGTAGLGVAGLGFRVYLNKYALLKTELRDDLDFRNGGLEHRLNLLAGASVLWGGEGP